MGELARQFGFGAFGDALVDGDVAVDPAWSATAPWTNTPPLSSTVFVLRGAYSDEIVVAAIQLGAGWRALTTRVAYESTAPSMTTAT